jgi:hypothetical protein
MSLSTMAHPVAMSGTASVPSGKPMSLLEKYSVQLKDMHKAFPSIKDMLQGVPEGSVMLSIVFEMFGVACS